MSENDSAKIDPWIYQRLAFERRTIFHNDDLYYQMDMLTAFSDLFEGMQDNLEVENLLRQVGVISPQTITESKNSYLCVYFRTIKEGYDFAKRFQIWLEKKRSGETIIENVEEKPKKRKNTKKSKKK